MIKEQRMYCVSPRHLSGIQKGIQSAHAIIEYSNFYKNNEDYIQWTKKDKTLILLEINSTDELKKLHLNLINLNYPVHLFLEPDINDSITAIAFLLDEEVWNSEKYITVSKKVEKLRELVSPLRLASN